MKKSLIITGLGLVLLFALIAAGPPDEFNITQPVPSRESYAKQMDALIAACREEGAAREAGFLGNGKSASLSRLKGYFFSQNKDRLISQMMAAWVDPSPRAVQHFADKRFFAVLHTHDPMIAKTYLAPWQERPSALSRLQN